MLKYCENSRHYDRHKHETLINWSNPRTLLILLHEHLQCRLHTMAMSLLMPNFCTASLSLEHAGKKEQVKFKHIHLILVSLIISTPLTTFSECKTECGHCVSLIHPHF